MKVTYQPFLFWVVSYKSYVVGQFGQNWPILYYILNTKTRERNQVNSQRVKDT